MLAGIYYGAQYGGSTTAILVNMPGRGVLGGHLPRRLPDGAPGPRRRGAGDRGASARSSPAASPRWSIAAFAPPLAELALKFGPAEYFSLMVLGLVAAVVLAHGSLLKAIAMIVARPAARHGRHRRQLRRRALHLRHSGARPTASASSPSRWACSASPRSSPTSSTRRSARSFTQQGRRPAGRRGRTSGGAAAPILRGTALGSVARHPARRRRGARPRSPPTRWRRSSPKDPTRFGKGAIEGVAGPESANNAGAQTSFIPLLTLGIPSNAVMALMIGAMMIQGIAPGPQVMTEQPGAVLGPDRLDVDRQPDAGDPQPAADRHLGQAAARCPTGCSIPAILLFCCIGVYSPATTAPFDVLLTALFGVARLRLRQARAASRRRCCSASSSGR